MTRLLNVEFNGFKLGMRVADQYALQANVTNAVDVAGLHAIRNLVNVSELSRSVNALSVNNVLYVPGTK